MRRGKRNKKEKAREKWEERKRKEGLVRRWRKGIRRLRGEKGKERN